MMGAPQNVALWPHLQFKHNYNIVSRESIYTLASSMITPPRASSTATSSRSTSIRSLQVPQLSVWDAQHPEPAEWGQFRAQAPALVVRRRQGRQLARVARKEFEKIARPAWKAIIGWPGCFP